MDSSQGAVNERQCKKRHNKYGGVYGGVKSRLKVVTHKNTEEMKMMMRS